MYIFESQEALEEYWKSDVWKNVMLPIIKGEPKVEKFVISATLDAGVGALGAMVLSTTKPGALLKNAIPVRTFSD